MKPFQPIPELEHLTPEHLEKVHDIIRSTTYAEAQQDIHIRYGIKLSINKLFRYLQKLNATEELSSVDDNLRVTVNDYVNLLNGQPVPFSAAGINVIQKRAFELACSQSTSASLLKDLFRIFTWSDRHSLAERKVQVMERKSQLAERVQKFREDQVTNPDEGKLLTPEERTRGFQKIFGMFPDAPDPNPDPSLTLTPALNPAPAPDLRSIPNPIPLLPPSETDLSSQTPANPIGTQLPVGCPGSPNRDQTVSNGLVPSLDVGTAIRSGVQSDPQFADAASNSAIRETQFAIRSHTERRRSSYLPQPSGQPPIERDESWKDECPCGQELPCGQHGDLWREVRYTKPWDPDYVAALARRGIQLNRDAGRILI